ncbi:ABC transporter permease [Synechococcus sp. MIT S9452]|uniref:ABC transporter permease n=1 Tax=Synechococcus sp. MIT S9452 TaxID=3082546 RepID=UPI0039A70E12|tara:strand:+ start:1217 stop:2062 length:846 start_codon:yes stop_codon:yes gene_type:complete
MSAVLSQVGPVGSGADWLVSWLLDNGGGAFALIRQLVDGLQQGVNGVLAAPPPWLFAVAVAAFGLWRISGGFALFCLLGLNLVLWMGLWSPMLATLALVISASLLALALGLPIGILAARQRLVWRLTRPVLDLMQTMPAFVYLIPAVMFFSTGQVPAIIATLIFAMPPVVRLTVLGLKQVPQDLLEAGQAFGCSSWQLLLKVELPSALPTLMAGVNQTIMLSLSMVVITSMIGGGGLGDVVLRGIQQLNVGLGFEGGLAVVILAIILDRLSQSLVKAPQRP